MNFLNSFISAIKPRPEDDGIDRLNYYYTSVLLLLFSVTISARQYVGAPIQCWVPAQFTGAWEQYAENYCFVQNTFWLRMHDNIPNSIPERGDRQIAYYQWVPFILAIEAAFFYFPVLVWRQFNWQGGINIQSIVKMAADTNNIQHESREKAVTAVSAHIWDAIEMQRHFLGADHGSIFTILWHCGKTRGVYVSVVYVFCKVLYVINLIMQFVLLNSFLDPRYTLWGAQTLLDLAHGVEWEESGHFPRVTLCDFEVRVLGNVHRYTIQCVLMVNMFNEKIFIFLWWWFVLVLVATVANLFYWISLTLSDRARHLFVMKYLRVSGAVTSDDRHLVESFVQSALRHDGVFTLRMLASHAGDLLTTEIVRSLWQSFKKRGPTPHKGMTFVDTGGGKMEPFAGYLERLTPPPQMKSRGEPGPVPV